MNKIIIILVFFLSLTSFGQTSSYQIALLKYNGGGDWYANLETSLPNLISYCNKNLKTNINEEQGIVDIGSSEIFNYPFLHITGHGNIVLNGDETENLRNYLIGGGFLHISDNYGMDKFLRPQMKKVFPELEFVEIKTNLPNSNLTGYVLVFFNGSTSGANSSYNTIDLSGFKTDIIQKRQVVSDFINPSIDSDESVEETKTVD